MKNKILSWLLTAAIVIGLLPAAAVTALADELSGEFTLSDDYISVSVSKKNGGFAIRTVEGDRLKKSDNDKDLLYRSGEYDTSFVSFRVGDDTSYQDYLFGGDYGSRSSKIVVTEDSGAITAVWSVDGLTFTQSITLAGTESNESGMVSLNLSVTNGSGKAVPVRARVLYDTALGGQDFSYYQYNDTSANPKTHTVTQEALLESDIPKQLYATDDPYSPSIQAYSVTSGLQPTKVAFGHWSHLASTLYDFQPVTTLDFTSTRSEYMTADSAYALYFNLGSVADGDSASLNTYYGVFSNHATPASDSVAVNLTAPVRLTLSSDKPDFEQENGAKGDAHFAVTVNFTNIAGEGAQDLSNVVLAVQSSRNLRSLDDNGENGQASFEETEPFTIPYGDLKVGQSETKTLYFQAQPGTDAAYERITVGVYTLNEYGQISETNKLGERMAYVLLPGSDNDVPQVNFAAMTPKIIYTEGTRHLFVTVANESMLDNRGNWKLKAYSLFDEAIWVEIPNAADGGNITFKGGVMDVALTENLQLAEGDWYLRLEWTDEAVSSGVVPAEDQFQTAPELQFTVSADKKYKNDAYGVLAVVEYKVDSDYSHEIVSFRNEEDFTEFRKDTTKYEEILLTFKGEFSKKMVEGKAHYIAASTKTIGSDGKYVVDNPVVINGCMDFEGGSLEVWYNENRDICTEFDGELYTNTERSSIWKGRAIFTRIESGKNYSLIPYNENGERASYSPKDKTKLEMDEGRSFSENNNVISLVWPSTAGIGQTLSGMIFKMAYAQLGVMYDTENQTNKIEDTIGCVLSFTAALDLTFASGKVNEAIPDPPSYWTELRGVIGSYDHTRTGSFYEYVYGNDFRAGKFQQALSWSEIEEKGNEDNQKHVKGSVMVRDVLFGCGEGFIGVNFEVGVAIKNYISGLPEIEGTIAVSTINDWAFGIEGKIELATITVEAKVSFKSKDNIPIPDELYVFVSGFEPGLNIDGCGVIWITGAGGGIKDIYDSIFMTQAVPPLKLLLSVSFDIVKVLTCEKATLSLGLTGISLQAEGIGIKKIESLTAIEKMGLSLEWYPGIDLRANISVNLFQGLISGGGYIVLISPDYQDVFFEMFARAQLMVPSSIPIVGGMKLADIDLGINSEKIWGALEVLFITLGVTYYWGEGSVDFSKGSKTNPTFPDLLGYDDIPVCYDAETDQTLYARIGTNTSIMASSLPDDGSLKLMDSTAELHCTDGNKKTAYWFNLGDRRGEADAIVQISFEAEDEADALAKANTIKVLDKGGADYGLVRFDTEKDQNDPANQKANANLSYDAAAKKATFAFTATEDAQYGKVWNLTTPVGSDVILYNVDAVPEVTEVTGTVKGSSLELTWAGNELSELDQISFYLCESNDPESSDPGYRIDAVKSDLDRKAATLTIPADVPSGNYYVRAVYSKSDEVNGVVFSKGMQEWKNNNTPDPASFTPKAAGNLQYELTIDRNDSADGYLVTIYEQDANGKLLATDFESVSYDAVKGSETVILVGGRYTSVTKDENGKDIEKTFGLTGGETYTIGVTPYRTVTVSGGGETAVYGAEATQPLLLPEMVTPTVTFTADKTAQSRTEANLNSGEPAVAMPVYTASDLTITAGFSENVTGTWRLDSEETCHDFSGKSTQIALTDLAEGEHTVTLQGAADDGDSFAATYTFTVDTLPPQLLISAPVNGGFFNADGTLTVTGVTDADARFTIEGTDCVNRQLTVMKRDENTGKWIENSGELNPSTGAFSFTVKITDPDSAVQHLLTVSVADDVGNTTVPQTVEVSHGGLANLAALEVRVGDHTYDSGNIPVPAAGLDKAELTLVGVTSTGRRFNLTGYNVIWEISTVEGTASIENGRLTAAAGSQGIVTGRLAVTSGASRSATLCFGAPAEHTVAVSATIGGTVTGGGQYNPGDTVTLTATPESGYRFVGWTITGASVSDPSAATVAFKMPASGNVTAVATFAPIGASESRGGLYAAAGSIARAKADGLPYYIESDGSEVFVPVTARINGETLFLAPRSTEYFFKPNPVSFTDTAGHWAADDILFAAEREIFRGTGGGKFEPNGTMTRAMFVTVLWRIAGSPAAGSAAFDDVAADAWYADAVAWGAANDIVKGYGNGRFGPNDLVTREQMCALIVRYLDYAGFTLPAQTDAADFADADAISDWAREAVGFCQTRGLVNGRPDAVFDPAASATRAENCAVFHRLIVAILTAMK